MTGRNGGSTALCSEEESSAFEDNGCGDPYCWLFDGSPEPTVVFFDREEQTESGARASFTAWLAETKF